MQRRRRGAAIWAVLLLGACSPALESGAEPQTAIEVGGATQSETTRSTPTPTPGPALSAAVQAPTTAVPTTDVPTTDVPTTEVRPAADPRFSEALDWLAAAEGASVQVSASVRNDQSEELWSLNPDLRLFPASNQKLLTAAGALELLPSDHRFETVVSVHDDRPGELFVTASGDPTLTSGRLASLARTIAGTTTDTIDTLVLDTSRWATAYRNPGWQDWHIPTYVGPLSVFMVDDNRWSKEERFTTNPDLVNAERFASQLRSAGLAGRLNVVLASAAPTGSRRIASVESPPLGDLVASMMLSSDNQIADALIREVDAFAEFAAVGTQRPADTLAGLARIREALVSSGVPVAGDDGDGSGLSRANLRSASEWTGFLNAVSDEPWFDSFTLPVAGRSGTLSSRLGGPSTAGNVRAKTGTIIGGRALSGYLTLASGEEVSFSIVVNGDGSHGMLDEIDRWVGALASVRLT